MITENRNRISDALTHLRAGLVPFINDVMTRKAISGWPDAFLPKEFLMGGPTSPDEYLDVGAALTALTDRWDVFEQSYFSWHTRDLAYLIRNVRNRWAHNAPSNDAWFTSFNTVNALRNSAWLLRTIFRPAEAEKIERIASDPELLNDVQEELRARSPADATKLPLIPPDILIIDEVTQQLLDWATHSASLSLDFGIDGCLELHSSTGYRGWAAGEFQFSPLASRRSMSPDLESICKADFEGPPNNPKYELLELQAYSTERQQVHLTVAPTSYFRTLPIQESLRSTLVDGSGRRWIPLERYRSTLLDFGNSPLPSVLVCPIVVVLRDGRLLLTQRPARGVDWEVGKWSCSIEEQMSGPPQPGTAQDHPVDKNPFDTVRRGVSEELLGELISIPDDDIRILSIVVEGSNLMVNIVAIARLNLAYPVNPHTHYI